MKLVQAAIVAIILLIAFMQPTLLITFYSLYGKDLVVNLVASLIFGDEHIQRLIKMLFLQQEHNFDTNAPPISNEEQCQHNNTGRGV